MMNVTAATTLPTIRIRAGFLTRDQVQAAGLISRQRTPTPRSSNGQGARAFWAKEALAHRWHPSLCPRVFAVLLNLESDAEARALSA